MIQHLILFTTKKMSSYVPLNALALKLMIRFSIVYSGSQFFSAGFVPEPEPAAAPSPSSPESSRAVLLMASADPPPLMNAKGG